MRDKGCLDGVFMRFIAVILITVLLGSSTGVRVCADELVPDEIQAEVGPNDLTTFESLSDEEASGGFVLSSSAEEDISDYLSDPELYESGSAYEENEYAGQSDAATEDDSTEPNTDAAAEDDSTESNTDAATEDDSTESNTDAAAEEDSSEPNTGTAAASDNAASGTYAATGNASDDPAASLAENSENDVSQENASAQAAFSKTVISDGVRVTVTAPAGVLPEAAVLVVEEIRPVTQEKADAYAETLTSLSETLRGEDKSYSSAKVYDICFADPEDPSVRIEPSGDVQVRMEYITAQDLGGDAAAAKTPVEVAHVTPEGEVQLMDADVKTDAAGSVEAAEFTTDGFSYYIVFGTQAGSESEPQNIGSYGWLKFKTPESAANWGHYASEEALPATDTEDGYHRILKVNLHILRPGGTENSYDDENYNQVSTNEYFWTWENSIYISDFYVPGYEVVQTKMHTAWDSGDPVQQDSLVGNYSVRGYRSSDGTSSDLNILDVYMKSVPTPETAMRYIIRYVHADGSVTDGNVRYLPSGSVTVDLNKPRSGEQFSGIAIAAGTEAVDVDYTAKTATFTYDENVDLAKAYVYFEAAPENNTVQTKGRFDKTNGRYYNNEKGLYTDKSAETVEGKDREFLVNLEAWYVDDAASVGMILDASGSMAWVAGIPTELDLDSILNGLDDTTKNRILTKTSKNNPIEANDLNQILDRTAVDNSNNGYNGYKYYVRTETATALNPISEYVALGYSDGRRDISKTADGGAGALILGNNGTTEGYADATNYGGAGWYYVNSSTKTAQFGEYGAKRFEGIGAGHMNDLDLGNANSAARFWVETKDGKHVLKCLFNCGNDNSPTATYPYVNDKGVRMLGPGTQESYVYVKRDQMMTKAETLQDSIAQFAAILNGVSPTSEVAMARFSHRDFNDLTLLGWTTESEKMASAMDLIKNGTGSGTRTQTEGSDSYTNYQYGITGGTVAYRGVKEYQDSYKTHADNGSNHKYLIIFTDGKDQGVNDSKNGTVIRNSYSMDSSYTGSKINLDTDFAGYTVITMFMRSVGMLESDVSDSRAFLKGIASKGKNGDSSEPLFYEATSESSHDVVEQFRKIAEHITTGLHNYSVRDYIDPRFDVVNEAGQVLSVLDSNGAFTHSTNPDVDETTHLRGFTTPDGKQAQLGYDPDRKMFFVLWQHQDIQASPVNSPSLTADVMPWKSQIRLVAKEDFLGGNDILTNGNLPDENLVYKPVTGTEKTQSGYPVATSDEYGRETVNTRELRKSFPFASVDPGLLDVALGNYEDTIFLGEEITPGELLSTMLESYTADSDNPADKRSDENHRVADTVYNKDLMKQLARERAEAAWDALSAEQQAQGSKEAYAAAHENDFLSSVWYIEYLERLGVKRHGNISYYGTLLRHINLTGTNGVQPIIEALKADSNYTVNESAGTVTVTGKKNTAAAYEKITIVKTGNGTAKVELELPYYYLDSPTDPAQYAGRDRADAADPMDDRVGTMKYTWTLKEFADNIPAEDGKPEANDFVSFDTYVDKSNHMNTGKAVQYQFAMSYTPLTYADDGNTANDGGDNGSDRTKALTGQMKNAEGDLDYLIRDAVGTERTGTNATTDEMGWAVIHAVDGRILIEKRMLTTDYNQMKAKTPGASFTLTLTGKKITSAPADEAVWTNTIALNDAKILRTEDDYTFLDLSGETPAKNLWVTGLPLGDYTLTETVSGGFADPVIEGQDTVRFYGSDAKDPEVSDLTGDPAVYKDPAQIYNGTAANWKANYSGSVTWNIGQVSGGTPAAVYYADTNYTYAKVEDDLSGTTPKEVDPLLSKNSGKDYLSAQLGRARVTNGPAKTSITVSKTWQGVTPSAPIVVELTGKLAGQEDVKYYVELSGSNSWSDTVGNLNVDGTVYTALEGTGTVKEDGSCPDFAAFDTAAAHFTFDGKTYRQISVTYEDKVPQGVTPVVASLTNAVAANVKDDAGSVAFTNQCVTKVSVEKKWEGITPGQPSSPAKPLVIRLVPSSGDPYYIELNPDNAWKHTFEDIPAAAGLTYTIEEGTGTVVDGACTDFAALPTDGTTFTFDGKTYRQKADSVLYTAAADGSKPSSTPLDGSVSPDAGKAEVTNEALTKVKVEKVWNNPADPGNESLYVQLYKVSGGAESAAGDPVELKKNAWTHTFENLKVESGVTYTVKEGTLSGGTFTPYEGSFEFNEQRMRLKSTELYSDEEKTTEAQELSGSVSPFGGVAVLTNELVLAHVKIRKVDSKDTDTVLQGVTFELYKDAPAVPAGDDPVYNAAADTEKVADAEGNTAFVTDAEGIITLPDLVPGDYWLKETHTITGYLMPENEIPALLSVDEDGNVTLSADPALPSILKPTIGEPDTEGFYTVTVPNRRTYMLPETGGGGLFGSLAGGAGIAGMFLALLLFFRRRSIVV